MCSSAAGLPGAVQNCRLSEAATPRVLEHPTSWASPRPGSVARCAVKLVVEQQRSSRHGRAMLALATPTASSSLRSARIRTRLRDRPWGAARGSPRGHRTRDWSSRHLRRPSQSTKPLRDHRVRDHRAAHRAATWWDACYVLGHIGATQRTARLFASTPRSRVAIATRASCRTHRLRVRRFTAC